VHLLVYIVAGMLGSLLSNPYAWWIFWNERLLEIYMFLSSLWDSEHSVAL
jgi:hypothetical protein